jgi:hypothetical protein
MTDPTGIVPRGIATSTADRKAFVPHRTADEILDSPPVVTGFTTWDTRHDADVKCPSGHDVLSDGPNAGM